MKTALKNKPGKKCFALLSALVFLLLLPQAYPQKNDYTTLEISIPPQFSEVAAGDFVFVIVDIYLYDGKDMKDLPVTYTIRDEQGRSISRKTMTVAVQTHLSEIGKLGVPRDIKPGKYTLEVEVISDETQMQKAKAEFNVVERYAQQPDYSRYMLYLIILITLLVFFAVYLIYRLIKIEEKRIMHGKG